MEHAFTLAQQIAAVRREIQLREFAYPRRQGMTPERAAREIGLMLAVLASLQTIKDRQ